ncbi:hypothetical protein EJB05_06307, partial [Eragrostis curvula]
MAGSPSGRHGLLRGGRRASAMNPCDCLVATGDGDREESEEDDVKAFPLPLTSSTPSLRMRRAKLPSEDPEESDVLASHGSPTAGMAGPCSSGTGSHHGDPRRSGMDDDGVQGTCILDHTYVNSPSRGKKVEDTSTTRGFRNRNKVRKLIKRRLELNERRKQEMYVG